MEWVLFFSPAVIFFNEPVFPSSMEITHNPIKALSLYQANLTRLLSNLRWWKVGKTFVHGPHSSIIEDDNRIYIRTGMEKSD